MQASATNCPLTHAVHKRMCDRKLPLPLCQHFIPQPVPSFFPFAGFFSLPWLPGSCALSYLLHFPLSVSRFPLASSSTCKQAHASSSILKHPPFFSLLPSASPPAPLLTFPFLWNLSGHSTSALHFPTPTSTSQLFVMGPCSLLYHSSSRGDRPSGLCSMLPVFFFSLSFFSILPVQFLRTLTLPPPSPRPALCSCP